jgi:wyosine [tRNA(Phe)-imidazoG37] synthetase (radical SAM superfamily)
MKPKTQPRLLYADEEGSIFDHPELSLLCRKGEHITLPRPGDLVPLPQGSDIFLLPRRKALGMDPESGDLEYLEANAVAAFVCPGYTLTGSAAYLTNADAGPLPLFAYAAVGYAEGKFWVCANRTDSDRRQQFGDIPDQAIERGARTLLKRHPENRLLRHLSHCALEYGCPAAKNLALGRFEAPLPTASSCNAECVGCISLQPEESSIPATQERIRFRPTPGEITQIMRTHAHSEEKPIFSFGQGCEGEPLTEAKTIRRAIEDYRKKGGRGTININTNASLPESLAPLSRAGLDSIRVSLNSVRSELYMPYFRPRGYSFQEVTDSIRRAKEKGLFVSLNYLYFPGVNDTEEEFEALAELVEWSRLDFIQLRNLNLDPELYLQVIPAPRTPAMGLSNLRKRLKKNFPWIEFGYFNPYLPE